MFHRRERRRKSNESESPKAGNDEVKETSSSSSDVVVGNNNSSEESTSSSSDIRRCFTGLDPMVEEGKSINDSKNSAKWINETDETTAPSIAEGSPTATAQQNSRASPSTGNGNGGGFSFFSLSGIRSLISGFMRFGSPGKPPQVDRRLAMYSGCTAVTVIVTESQVVVANAGDSRCVLCRGQVAVELSKDHKPQLPEERVSRIRERSVFVAFLFILVHLQARIYSAGGCVEMGRVNGNLNLSRALGDLVYKCNANLPPSRQIISAVPDVVFTDLVEQDEFLVIHNL